MQPSIANELLESVLQFEAAWRAMCHDFPEAEFTSLPGLSIVWPDVPLAFFNIALLTGEVADAGDLKERAQTVLAYMKTKRQPGLLVVCEEMLSPQLRNQAAEALAEVDLYPAMLLTGMAATQLEPMSRPVSGIGIRRARGGADAQTIFDLNCRAYGIPIELGRGSIPELLKKDSCHAFIAELSGEPVACAATFPVEGRRYVGMVATAPEHQRHGYAEAVMRASLDSCGSASQIERTILHATDAGRPVYRRMGYHDTATFTMYAPKEHQG